MTESISQPLPALPSARPLPPSQRERTRLLVSIALWTFVLGNLAGVLYIWGAGGEDGTGYHFLRNFDLTLESLGRLTAIASGYLALVEVLLLARLPFLERLVGFDRLTIWHRWNGHAVLDLALAHVVFTVWGYSRVDGVSWFTEYWHWLTLPQPTVSTTSAAPASGHCHSLTCAPPPATGAISAFPGIITATVGTALLLVVLVTSLVVLRRKLSYEWWYFVHFTAYAGIALAFLHMVPDGNDLHVDHIAGDYWISLFAFSLALVLYYRLLRPVVNTFRFGLKVSEVVEEGPGVISMRISGRNLDRLHTRAGQFYFWRFFAKGFWYTQHPFSLSEAPKDGSFRITVKALGDHSAKFGRIPLGTRVFAEGPFGVFTAESRTTDKALLIAGGIGITPVRALLEEMDGDLIAVYRVMSNDDLVLKDELDKLAADRGVKVDYVVGDHTTEEGRRLLTPAHLKELVPDIAERDVYICGPVAMIDSVIPNLRNANVSRKHLHVERFAL